MFKRVCDDFLLLPSSYKDALRSLLTDSFQIIDYARVPKFEDFKILSEYIYQLDALYGIN